MLPNLNRGENLVEVEVVVVPDERAQVPVPPSSAQRCRGRPFAIREEVRGLVLGQPDQDLVVDPSRAPLRPAPPPLVRRRSEVAGDEDSVARRADGGQERGGLSLILNEGFSTATTLTFSLQSVFGWNFCSMKTGSVAPSSLIIPKIH